MSGHEFRLILSCDINSPVTYRVDRLEGNLSCKSSPEGENGLENHTPELYVECALYLDGVLFGLPTRTKLESTEKPNNWNAYSTLTAKYRDLTPCTQLAFTVWDVSSSKQDVVVGGATLCLFNSKKHLKTGQQKLRLCPGRKADGSFNSTTPGKVHKHERGEIEHLEKLENKYERGQIQRVKWLDELTFKAIREIKERERQGIGMSHLHLIVHLWPFEHPVFFQELGANYLLPSPISSSNELVLVWDPEVGRTNPCENKQVKLARSLTRGVIDRELKPSSDERKKISKILKHPPTCTLNGDERQLLWKFRYYLVSDKRALTKFLRCVEWSDAQAS